MSTTEELSKQFIEAMSRSMTRVVEYKLELRAQWLFVFGDNDQSVQEFEMLFTRVQIELQNKEAI